MSTIVNTLKFWFNTPIMKIISVNRRVTLETVGWRHGEPVLSGINKQPVDSPLMITFNGLEGDSIADKKHHGGEFKAIYTYAGEHYDFWRHDLNRPELAYGAFGENLTTWDFDESKVHIGDQFRVGEAVIQATEPRQPCWVLGKHMDDAGLIKRFLDSGRLGIYFKVLSPGMVHTGAQMVCIYHDAESLPISEITRLHTQDKNDRATLEKMLTLNALPPEWHRKFEKQLAKIYSEL